jgi:hypothetical protein
MEPLALRDAIRIDAFAVMTHGGGLGPCAITGLPLVSAFVVDSANAIVIKAALNF